MTVYGAGLATACLAVLAMLVVPPGSAAQEVSGSAKFTLGSGKVGSSLTKAKVRFSARSGAVWTSLKGGRARTVHPVTSIGIGSGADVRAGGAIRFTRGKRKVEATRLQFMFGVRGGPVKATVGGSRINLFLVSGPVVTDGEAGTVAAAGRDLLLTGRGASLLKKRLGIRKLTPGAVGSFGLSGRILPIDPPDIEDPYLQQCGLAATTEAAGDLPEPDPLPVLVGSRTTVGDDMAWGFKESFRNYVSFGGSIFGLDGATAETVPPSPAVQGFVFPQSSGTYSSNDGSDMTDDQAIINGTGTALFCRSDHGFRIAISDPTVVIDGEDSRIVADLDVNFRGVWIPSQRIDLARLDLEGITPFYNRSGAEVTWSDVPVSITEAGSRAFCDPEGSCFYSPGEALDPITIEVALEYPVPEDPSPTAESFTALANYVDDQLAFQLDDDQAGGCTLPISPDTTPFRTIDEDVALNPAGFTKPVWKGVPGNPAPLPELTGSQSVQAGAVKWGFRGSFRGSINGTGAFNLSSGVTASNTPYYGTGDGALAPASPRNGTANPVGQMGGTAGRFFSWPAAGGTYEERQSGGDRLVIEGSGRVAFCQTATSQWYGVVFSDPTVVIDGVNSRITMDVATRYRYSWVRGRVDIATLDLNQATIESVVSGDERVLSWSFPAATGSPAVGPVTLTADGEQVVNMLSSAQYTAGLGLDGLTVEATVPAE